ncbi:hypothetical protein CYMTET_33966, partial [Cymbomonas tetramitiformis]
SGVPWALGGGLTDCGLFEFSDAEDFKKDARWKLMILDQKCNEVWSMYNPYPSHLNFGVEKQANPDITREALLKYNNMGNSPFYSNGNFYSTWVPASHPGLANRHLDNQTECMSIWNAIDSANFSFTQEELGSLAKRGMGNVWPDEVTP